MSARATAPFAPRTQAAIADWFNSLNDPELRLITKWLSGERHDYWGDYPRVSTRLRQTQVDLPIGPRIHAAHGTAPLDTWVAPTADDLIERGKITYAVTELTRITDNCLARRTSPFTRLRRFTAPADVHLSELVELVDYSRANPKSTELIVALLPTWRYSVADLHLCAQQLSSH